MTVVAGGLRVAAVVDGICEGVKAELRLDAAK